MSRHAHVTVPNRYLVARSRNRGHQLSLFPDLSTFGGRLRFARNYRGIADTELAERANIGLATIRDLEAGLVTTTPFWIAKLADALECDVTWLTTGKARVAA